LLALGFAASWLLLIGVGSKLAMNTDKKVESFRWPILLAILAGLLLGPTLLTIRLEQRWLLMPFAVLMLIPTATLALCSGRVRQVLIFVCVGMCTFGLVLDGMISKSFDKVYLFRASKFAAEIKHSVIDGSVDNSGAIVLVASKDDCSWTLDNGSFFQAYGGKSRSITCEDNIERARQSARALGARIYEFDAFGKAKEVNPESRHGGLTGSNVDFLAN
jgi:hypothetical protein